MNGPDFIGLIGVAAYLSAYGLLQLGTLKVEDSRYALLNALGADTDSLFIAVRLQFGVLRHAIGLAGADRNRLHPLAR